MSSIFIFFFQAEDGIRDGTVTGVQTCALPILNAGIAWDEKGEGQPGMQQAFDGQGIEKADRRTEQPEGDPAAGALGHPAEEMDGVASGEKVDTCIDLCQLGLDGLE